MGTRIPENVGPFGNEEFYKEILLVAARGIILGAIYPVHDLVGKQSGLGREAGYNSQHDA